MPSIRAPGGILPVLMILLLVLFAGSVTAEVDLDEATTQIIAIVENPYDAIIFHMCAASADGTAQTTELVIGDYRSGFAVAFASDAVDVLNAFGDFNPPFTWSDDVISLDDLFMDKPWSGFAVAFASDAVDVPLWNSADYYGFGYDQNSVMLPRQPFIQMAVAQGALMPGIHQDISLSQIIVWEKSAMASRSSDAVGIVSGGLTF